MHEVGLMSDALKRAIALAEDAGARRIDRLVVTISGNHVTPESVETIFGSLSRGTPAEGAELIVERQPVGYRCWLCGTDYEALDDDRCPACGGSGLVLTEPAELTLTGIDIAN